MTLAEPCGFTQGRQAHCLDQRSPLPIMLTEAMVRQAEVDAAYLVVEAARADPMFQAALQAKATEARERAHALRAAFRRSMFYKAGAAAIDIGAPKARAEGVGATAVPSDSAGGAPA